MLLPTILLGTHREVASRCRKLLLPLSKGKALAEIEGSVEGIADPQGPLIVISGPSAALRAGQHFQIYALHAVVNAAYQKDQVSHETRERLFAESLERPWATAALNAPKNLGWVVSWEHSQALIDGTARFWDELTGVGDVYADGFPPGKPFWEVQQNVFPALKKVGLKDRDILAPLGPSGLPGLLERVGWKTGAGLGDDVQRP